MSPCTLVTGATRGIGRAIADRLARDGHQVIGIARTAETDFPHRLYRADLLDEAAVAAVMKAILAAHRVDNLVNNAGYSAVGPFGQLALGELDRMLEIHVRAAAQVSQAVIPGMLARGAGGIVNIGSKAQAGRPFTAAYSAAKAGLAAMTVCWALEYAEHGIRVNMVAPGAVSTEMLARNNPPGSANLQRMVDAIPLRRLGRPEEIAGAVAFLLSTDAGYITGQTLNVCGGWNVASI